MKEFKKYKSSSIEFVKTGVVLSTGGSLVAGNANAVSGLNKFSQGLPSTGSILGAGMVLDAVKKLNKSK